MTNAIDFQTPEDNNSASEASFAEMNGNGPLPFSYSRFAFYNFKFAFKPFHFELGNVIHFNLDLLSKCEGGGDFAASFHRVHGEEVGTYLVLRGPILR